ERQSRSRRGSQQGSIALLNLTVTMLVLLPRTARTWFVATDLGIGAYRAHHRRRCRRLLVGFFRLVQRRHLFMLESHALRQLLGFTAQAGLFLGRIFTAHLDMGKHADRVALDGLEQVLEQGKGFALVFLFGVLLRIATQVNTVAQVIHGRQVVFPQIIQHTQDDLLLEGAQRFGACHFFLLVVGLDQGLQDALTQGFLVELVVFIEPLLNRKTDTEIARSEEHTSELQSRENLVCRLLLEKKK